MKSKSTIASFFVVALTIATAWPLASTHAAENERDDSAADVCLASIEEEAPAVTLETRSKPVATQGSGESMAAGGYCTLDCSYCLTDADCWSRRAGSCEPIRLCRQTPPGVQVK
ncbi:hypothetical protein [Archangium sp.]|uniref:hypothetical protein n=1 Tax=Archangium sp. TaxID=1872627 RepID=UPI002D53B67A|nr:hypothetical protein [Archangium sp.]HYO51175.1 hypothetical protein [Archangium sp.]